MGLYLRVNGIDIKNLKIRPKLVKGVPTGKRELVIEDPKLGKFAVDDNEDIPEGGTPFVLEVANSPRAATWKIVNVESFLAMVDSSENH